MDRTKFLERVIARLNATMLTGQANHIGKGPVSEDDIGILYDTICIINSMSPDQFLLNGVPVSEWKIPTSFKDFIFPAEVTYNSSMRLFNNLRAELYNVDAEGKRKASAPGSVTAPINYHEFEELWIKLFALYRINDVGFTSIKEAREAVDLDSIKARWATNDSKSRFRWDGASLVPPIRLAVVKDLASDAYWNTDVEDFMIDEIASKIEKFIHN